MSTFQERAKSLLGEARAELERIERLRDTLKDEADSIRKFIRAVEGPQPKTMPKQSRTRVSDSRVLDVGRAIVADMPTRFSQRDLIERGVGNSGTISLAFRRLREVEFLAKVGRDGNADVYSVLDAEALHRLNQDG